MHINPSSFCLDVSYIIHAFASDHSNGIPKKSADKKTSEYLVDSKESLEGDDGCGNK